MMRISGSVCCDENWPLHEALPALREIGYEAVELTWARIEREFASARDPLTAVAALLDEHGLALSGLNIADLAATHQDELGEAMVILRHQMSFARQLGATSVHLRGGDRRRQTLPMFTTGLDLVLGEAEDLGLDVCLANACGSRIEQIEDLRRVFLAMDHPQLRVLNDTGQFHLSAVNPRDVTAEFADRISAIRLTDRIARRCVPLGQGEINVQAVIEHAQRIGYAGWLVVAADGLDRDGTIRYLSQGRSYLASLLPDPG